MTRPNNTRNRRGSIPMVVGLATVLAALAASSMFMTNGMNRLDKRADLSCKAGWIAASAAEEVIVALMNGSAQWMTPKAGEKNVKLTYPAPATATMYGQTGALVDPVKILGRKLEEPGVNERERARFYGGLSAGPKFAPNHDDGWEARAQADPNLRRLMAPPAGLVPDVEARGAVAAALPPAPKGDDKVAQALAELAPGTGGRDLSKKLEKVGEAIAENAVSANCGNVAPDVGIVTTLGAIGLGRDIADGNVVNVQINPLPDQGRGGTSPSPAASPASGDPDAPAASEEDDGLSVLGSRNGVFSLMKRHSDQGGILRKDKYLITLEASASMAGGDMEIEVPHVTHRVFARLHYGEALMYAYGRFLAYVSVHYDVPYAQWQQMGVVSEEGQINPEKLMPAVEATYSARPGPQAWPFPVATSILRTAE